MGVLRASGPVIEGDVATIAKEKKRAETKLDRRARILGEAQRLIARTGFEGLSLRKLAAAAEVTVPTIYNLVGGKDVILTELFGDMVGTIETALEQIDEEDPLARAEAIIIEAMRLIREDQTFHRAALIAFDYLDRSKQSGVNWSGLGARAASMQERALAQAQKMGLLRGEIRAALLAERIFAAYTDASRKWASRLIPLDGFRREALEGVYLHFLADAAEGYRPVLLEKLRAL